MVYHIPKVKGPQFCKYIYWSRCGKILIILETLLYANATNGTQHLMCLKVEARQWTLRGSKQKKVQIIKQTMIAEEMTFLKPM